MPSTRLLLLPCLLCWSLISLSQDRQKPAVTESCSVTKPANDTFVPPSPHAARPSRGQFWFGTDRLWTAIPETGAWIGLGHYTSNDPTLRQKLIFWRKGYDAHAKAQAKLTVGGRRLDAPAPPLLTDGPGTPSWTADDQFLMTGINFPTIGCWEITGHYEDDALTFVVWVSE
jgi:hypothetical protein